MKDFSYNLENVASYYRSKLECQKKIAEHKIMINDMERSISDFDNFINGEMDYIKGLIVKDITNE